MTTTKGFTYKDVKVFNQLLTKANPLNLGAMILSVHKEIGKRVDRDKYKRGDGRK